MYTCIYTRDLFNPESFICAKKSFVLKKAKLTCSMYHWVALTTEAGFSRFVSASFCLVWSSFTLSIIPQTQLFFLHPFLTSSPFFRITLFWLVSFLWAFPTLDQPMAGVLLMNGERKQCSHLLLPIIVNSINISLHFRCQKETEIGDNESECQ